MQLGQDRLRKISTSRAVFFNAIQETTYLIINVLFAHYKGQLEKTNKKFTFCTNEITGGDFE